MDTIITDMATESPDVQAAYALMGDPEAIQLVFARITGERHLAGQHPQKSHGGGGGGGGPSPATDEEKAAFKAAHGRPIPPGWTDVYISKDPAASLMVVGRDDKGRRQAIYSTAHTESQAEAKFARTKELAKYTDKLDHAIERDALTNDDAASVMLMRKLGMRPGSTRDTGAEIQAFGATTLQARHVHVTPGGVTVLKFMGKSSGSKGHAVELRTRDPAIAAAMRARLATRKGNASLLDTNERRAREYMTSAGVPKEFHLKDLRTLHANTVALKAVSGIKPPKTKTEFRRQRKAVAEKVSAQLGNSASMALSSYINPTVFTPWVKDASWL
jgi:DNA topoisomerase I